MKKIIAIAIMGLLALGQSQAASINFDSTGKNISFIDENTGDALLTSDGWLVSFWWKQNAGDNFTAIGLAGFLDAGGWYSDVPPWCDPGDYDGMFFFGSENMISAKDSTEYYISIRIMQVDAATLSGLSFDYDAGALWSSAFGDSIADDIAEMWKDFGDASNAFNNESKLESSSNGALSGDLMSAMGWTSNQKVPIKADAIPEPSTWLLLGAGAAFVVVMRRRKK